MYYVTRSTSESVLKHLSIHTSSKMLYDSQNEQAFSNNLRTEAIVSIIKQRILALITKKQQSVAHTKCTIQSFRLLGTRPFL